MPNSRKKNFLQFNHGEKNAAHPRAEKKLHKQKSCPAPPSKQWRRQLDKWGDIFIYSCSAQHRGQTSHACARPQKSAGKTKAKCIQKLEI